MALTKYKLGQLLELCDERNSEGKYTLDDVKGISIQKCFIETKANMEGVSLSPYILVKPEYFAYVTVTSRNGEKITIALNTSDRTYIVSSSYVVFKVKQTELLCSEYLFMYFNRPEFDRYARFNSWGSARETFDWDTMRDIDIELPDITVQRQYVTIYKSMEANQQIYERGLEDLKLVCDGYVEEARRRNKTIVGRQFLLGELIEQRREKYDGSKIPIRGVSREGFIEPKQPDADLKMYNQYYRNDFVFNPARMEINSIALNSFFDKACCSSLYEIFYVKRPDVILPEYLNLLLKRSEFARWCEYVGWGSAREYCRVDAISQYPIVVPSIVEQKAIIKMSNAYMIRREINERLKAQIKYICPILIRGSLENGGQQQWQN